MVRRNQRRYSWPVKPSKANWWQCKLLGLLWFDWINIEQQRSIDPRNCLLLKANGAWDFWLSECHPLHLMKGEKCSLCCGELSIKPPTSPTFSRAEKVKRVAAWANNKKTLLPTSKMLMEFYCGWVEPDCYDYLLSLHCTWLKLDPQRPKH